MPVWQAYGSWLVAVGPECCLQAAWCACLTVPLHSRASAGHTALHTHSHAHDRRMCSCRDAPASSGTMASCVPWACRPGG